MGWTFIQADLSKSRREIIIGEVEWEYCSKSVKVLCARQSGGTIYMACESKDSETGYSNVFGVVALTQMRSKESFNFGYKLMDETMGPCYYDAPKSILDLLSPTDDEVALKWREACRARYKKSLEYCRITGQMRTLPYGTVLRLHDRNRTLVELVPYRGRIAYKIVGKYSRLRLAQIIAAGYEVVSKSELRKGIS